MVLKNYDETIAHQNGINAFEVGYGSIEGQKVTNLFTASRDRLIKLWSVDYSRLDDSVIQPGRANGDQSTGVDLLANLDEHTDWVNKVIHIEPVNTLISCSNDTTIRVWRLRSNEDYITKNIQMRQHNFVRKTYK